MIPPKRIDEVRNKLRKMILETNRGIVQDISEEDKWGFAVRHGNYIVLIIHIKNELRMHVIFSVPFAPEIVADIAKYRADPVKRAEFDFGLKSAISSPFTAYRINYDENKNIVGYDIFKTIFPFHEGFSIKDLNDAIQAVVSVGSLGIAFLEAILGPEKIKQEIAEAITKPPPDEMYG